MSSDGGRHQLPSDHPDYLAAVRPGEESDPSTDEVLTGRHGDHDGDGIANQADLDWSDPDDGTGYATAARGLVARAASRGLDAATLREAMGSTLSLARYQQLLPAFTSALIQAGCTTVNRAAMFCAQIGHESVGLKYGEEIASGAAYENRKDLGNTQRGDGVRFKGHGWIQITGRLNHTAVSKWAHGKGYVPSSTFFVDHPTELASDRYVWIGPVWYWTVARADINALCDRGDLNTVTRRINGGLNGLADRQRRWDACLRLGTRLLPAGPAPTPAPPPTSRALGTELVMDPIPFPSGAAGRRVFLDPPGARVIEAAWFSWVVDGPDGATATATLYPQKAGGGTGREKVVTSRVRTDGTHTVDRDVLEVPAGTDQITVWGPQVSPGAVAYLVPAFRAAK